MTFNSTYLEKKWGENLRDKKISKAVKNLQRYSARGISGY